METANTCRLCISTPKNRATLKIYGVTCCNACSMQHRKHCISSDQDAKTYIAHPNCRFCSFKRMVLSQDVNLQFTTIKIASMDLAGLINNLSSLNINRNEYFMDYYAKEKSSVDNAVISTINFIKKPPYLVFSMEEWTSINQLSTIDFIKKFDFVNQFSCYSDKSKFIHGVRFKSAIFSTSMRVFNEKKSYMHFPGNVDIFPEHSSQLFNPHFLNKIRSQLIGKLIELDITKNESLLLSALFLCSAVHPDISTEGKNLLYKYQQYYSAALINHCCLTNQQNAPSRYSELLSLYQIIEETHQKVNNFAILYRMKMPHKIGIGINKFE